MCVCVYTHPSYGFFPPNTCCNSLATIWEPDISSIQTKRTCVPLQAAFACHMCLLPRDTNAE